VETIFARPEENPGRLDHGVFGWKVKDGMKSYGWFKLLKAQKGAAHKHDDPRILEKFCRDMMEKPQDWSDADMFGYFYGLIGTHAEDKLAEEYTKDYVDETPRTTVLTVPANWSTGERNEIRSIARDCGGLRNQPGDKFIVVSEPEAAAAATILEAVEKDGRRCVFKVLYACHGRDVADTVQNGESTIVLDQGGGTIDVKGLVILRTSPLKLGEACVGQGKSTPVHLNEDFDIFLSKL